jgi:hypothetical protein
MKNYRTIISVGPDVFVDLYNSLDHAAQNFIGPKVWTNEGVTVHGAHYTIRIRPASIYSTFVDLTH